MKRKYATVFIGVMLVSLCAGGCGGENAADVKPNQVTESQESEEEAKARIALEEAAEEEARRQEEESEAEDKDTETTEEVPVQEEPTEQVPVDTAESGEDQQGSEIPEEPEQAPDPGYQVTEMSAVKYAQTSVNVRSGPGTDYEKLGSLSTNDEVTVTGQADTGWYRIPYKDAVGFVSDKYLGDEKVVAKPRSGSGNSGSSGGSGGSGSSGGSSGGSSAGESGTGDDGSSGGNAGEVQDAQETPTAGDLNSRIANNMSSYNAMAQEVVNLVNQERTNAGLGTLKFDSTLSKIATYRSIEGADNNLFSHTRPDGSDFSALLNAYQVNWSHAGENLAKYQMTAQEVVEDWMASPGHRANILDAKFNNIGVGLAVDSSGYYYWTQIFD